MRKSQIGPAVTSRIRRDLIHQPLLLLSGVDFLGNASSTIGTLSKGAAQLSNDGKYLRLRSKKVLWIGFLYHLSIAVEFSGFICWASLVMELIQAS